MSKKIKNEALSTTEIIGIFESALREEAKKRKWSFQKDMLPHLRELYRWVDKLSVRGFKEAAELIEAEVNEVFRTNEAATEAIHNQMENAFPAWPEQRLTAEYNWADATEYTTMAYDIIDVPHKYIEEVLIEWEEPKRREFLLYLLSELRKAPTRAANVAEACLVELTPYISLEEK